MKGRDLLKWFANISDYLAGRMAQILLRTKKNAFFAQFISEYLETGKQGWLDL